MTRNGTDSRITPPGVPIAVSERAQRRKRETARHPVTWGTLWKVAGAAVSLVAIAGGGAFAFSAKADREDVQAVRSEAHADRELVRQTREEMAEIKSDVKWIRRNLRRALKEAE